MFRFIIIALLFGLLGSTACAAPTATQEQLDSTRAALQQYYPKLANSAISSTPVDGLYEVLMENDQAIYFMPQTGHVLVGELWSPDGQNLTQLSKSQRMSALLKEIPLDKALVIGSGPNQVIEFTDPDCPFCRKASEFFAGRTDVTRYVFLFPLTRLHPDAEKKALFILNSEDPAAAYEAVFSGEYDDKPVPATGDNGQLKTQRDIADTIGITGTPQFWINGQHVSGFNPNAFDQLLTK